MDDERQSDDQPAAEQRQARSSPTDRDPAGPAVPPSNPPRDDEAVRRSEEELRKVTGH